LSNAHSTQSALCQSYFHKQELAFGGRFIRNAVSGARQNFVSFADREHAPIVRTAGLDGESTPQHEIMILWRS
jgi:hypothetical protein